MTISLFYKKLLFHLEPSEAGSEGIPYWDLFCSFWVPRDMHCSRPGGVTMRVPVEVAMGRTTGGGRRPHNDNTRLMTPKGSADIHIAHF